MVGIVLGGLSCFELAPRYEAIHPQDAGDRADLGADRAGAHSAVSVLGRVPARGPQLAAAGRRAAQPRSGEGPGGVAI